MTARKLCPYCGAGISGSEVCSSCGNALEHGVLARPDEHSAVWMIDIPLVNNRFIMWDVFRAFFIAGGIMFLIMAVIFLFQGEYDVIPMMALVSLCCTGFLIVLGIFAMAVMLRNRIRSSFTIDQRGIGYAMNDKLARFWARAAIVGGSVRGNLTVTGSGLLAASRKQERYSWRDLKSYRAFPKSGVIELRNSWRVVVRLYCPEEAFEIILGLVRKHVPPA